MILRFCQGDEAISLLILGDEHTALPFTPSHVEARTEDGAAYIGAHIQGGTQRRLVGYDSTTTKRELLLPLAATPEQDAAFFKFLDGHIGEPYDWAAILGFVVPAHLHLANHSICSALMTLALRAPGVEFFKWPLAAPAHLINPRDLLLMLSAQMQIPGI